MLDVNFYLLSSSSSKDRYHFACKLTEKVYRSGQKVYILADSETECRQLDMNLWAFRAGSFVPHECYTGSPPHPETPVLIGTLAAPDNWQQTIINLSVNFPKNIDKALRVLEILDDDEKTKQAGRNRYRQYQQLGLNPVTHKI